MQVHLKLLYSFFLLSLITCDDSHQLFRAVWDNKTKTYKFKRSHQVLHLIALPWPRGSTKGHNNVATEVCLIQNGWFGRYNNPFNIFICYFFYYFWAVMISLESGEFWDKKDFIWSKAVFISPLVLWWTRKLQQQKNRQGKPLSKNQKKIHVTCDTKIWN